MGDATFDQLTGQSFNDPTFSTPISKLHWEKGDPGVAGFGENLVEPLIDAFSAAAAPFTGGASLAIPFALTGLKDSTTGNWGNIGGQLLGDAAAAIPFGAGQILGGAGGAALAGATEIAPFGETFGAESFGGAAGGLGGAVGGAMGDFGFGDQSGAFGGLGGGAPPTTGDFGGFVPSAPSFAPGSSDLAPQGSGGGGSAVTASNPFGTGMDPSLGGSASGSMTATPSTFGDPAAGAGGSAPALDPNANIDQEIAQWSTYGGGTPGAAPGAAATPDAGGTMGAGAGGTTGNQGWFGGLKDFLKQNKDLISLGTGVAGVGNAVWKNSQMQGGIDGLMKQAQQARLQATEFQQGYNALLQQALPLIQQGASGQVTPGQFANLMGTANRMKQQISARYAQQGGGNSTSLQQDLANVDLVIAGLQGTLAQSQLQGGAQLAQAATGQGGLNTQNAGAIGQFARLNAASDQDLMEALSMFAKASTQV